jgi:hypothetical protein
MAACSAFRWPRPKNSSYAIVNVLVKPKARFGLRLQTARIDDAVVRDFRVNQKEVTFIGEFESPLTIRDKMKVWLEEIDGKWYVYDHDP